ncbi:Oidioi.mRNA.OKI2018_I69.PAR.g10123.t2.cds [Oikopleura dioica]|uniref:IST1 homolog n=1 Tax=Oikopleura dioica TaxID=34765 RepID=A0ABN7RUS4_OIKDI|nr:Oidioi.mRNA.OKI2018_I69.PAR.g10123.t2.cds [Oikopleura dioica]
MFKSKFNDKKFKTNCRICISRLKLVEKKKTEMALKARKEIADYLKLNKYDRARIRVEHIIREDYKVEALEITEMFLDLILARVGLIQMSNSIDIGLQEPINSIIWVQPRITDDCAELKTVVDELMKKYGKEHIQQCRQGMLDKHISTKLQDKLNQHSPKRSLVENYLIEIAKNYNVEFTPALNTFFLIKFIIKEDIYLVPRSGEDDNDGDPFDSGDLSQQLPYLQAQQPYPPQATGPTEMSIYNPGPIDPATNLPTIPGGPASPAYPGIPPTASMRLPSDNLPSIPGEPKKDAGSPGTRGMPEPAPKYTDIMNSPKYDDVAPAEDDIIPGLPSIPSNDPTPNARQNQPEDDDSGDDFDDLEARFKNLRK